MFLTLHLSFHEALLHRRSCLEYFHFAYYYLFSSEICAVLHWNFSLLNISVHNILYQAFIWIFFLPVDLLRSLLVSIASSQQNIIKIKFIMNASNIPYRLWAGLYCLLLIAGLFAYIFIAYISTHLLYCTFTN